MDQSQYSYLIAIPIILLVVALRLWRGSKARRLRVGRMWIFPLIFLVMIGAAVFALPPPGGVLTWAALGAAFAVGLGAGWLRGGMVRITVDVETGELKSQASPWAIVLYLGLIAVRFGLRSVLESHEADWGISAIAITDGFLLFFAGMIVGLRLEMWLRATRLLRESRASGVHGDVSEGAA